MPTPQDDHAARPTLVADIGGTNCRFALATQRGDGVALHAITHMANDEGPDFASLLERYLRHCIDRGLPGPVKEACLAVAAPVEARSAQLTNRDWRLDAQALEQRFGFTQVALINDFHALAAGVGTLTPAGLQPVREGNAIEGAPLCVLGPGTGLGVALVVNPGPHQIVIPTEGGHVDFAATDDAAWALRASVARYRGLDGAQSAPDAALTSVSAEHVLCGQGLALIDAHLRGNASVPQTPAEVTAAALDGEDTALQAVLWYLELLGGFAGDAALSQGARGGVFIGGGVVPRIASLLRQSSFSERFVNKGAMRAYAAQIPVQLITDPTAALSGAASYLWQQSNAA